MKSDNATGCDSPRLPWSTQRGGVTIKKNLLPYVAVALAVALLAYPWHLQQIEKQRAALALADLRSEIGHLSTALKRGLIIAPDSANLTILAAVDSVGLNQAFENLRGTRFRRSSISLVTGLQALQGKASDALSQQGGRPSAAENQETYRDVLKKLDRAVEILLVPPERITEDTLQELYEMGQYFSQLRLSPS